MEDFERTFLVLYLHRKMKMPHSKRWYIHISCPPWLLFSSELYFNALPTHDVSCKQSPERSSIEF